MSNHYPHELPEEPGKWYENAKGEKVECVFGMMTGERAEAHYAGRGPWRETAAPVAKRETGAAPLTELVGFTVVEFNQAGGTPYLAEGLTDLLDRDEAEAQIEIYKERQAYGRRRDRWQIAAVYIEESE